MAPALLSRRFSPLAPALVGALAAVLRFVNLGRTHVDPFYDAAIRSMGRSWHNLFVGAYDPSARLAIDKPPVDLWLQVASTKLFGFTHFALLLPAALGGTLGVLALYDCVRTLFGRSAGLAAALALAVLPLSVITSRSDTMDSVMATCVILAFALAARGLRSGRAVWFAGAGAMLGLAFEIKLFECLVAALPLALLWWLGARTTRRRRLAGLAAGAAAFTAVALAWLVAISTLPAARRPWAFGSSNGSAWNATFVYDGIDRLRAQRPPPEPRARYALGLPSPQLALRRVMASQRARANHQLAELAAPAPPGPLRLLSTEAHLGTRIGIELVGAWVALALVALSGALRSLDSSGRAGLAALSSWLALGTVLFSRQPSLHPRYLEAFDPAVAACLGVGIVLATRAVASRLNLRSRGAAFALGGASLCAVLAGPLVVSAQAVGRAIQDSGSPGALPAKRLAALSRTLEGRQGRAQYETASVAVGKAGALIAHDGRPVLILTASHGQQLVKVPELARLVAGGQVSSAIIGSGCTPVSINRWTGCSPAALWIRANGQDISLAAGQPHRGFLYALSPALMRRAQQRAARRLRRHRRQLAVGPRRKADRKKRHVRAVEPKRRNEAPPGQLRRAPLTRP